MKKIFMALFLVLTLFLFSNVLTIYTYESLSWIEESVISSFEEINNCKINVIKLGDTGNVLNRLRLEKIRPKADVVIGLDQSLSLLAVRENLLIPYMPNNITNLTDLNLIFDKDFFVTPFDYGAIAIIYDPERIPVLPNTFEDLTKNPSSLIFQNPRSSSTGQAFLLWTIAVFKDDWQDFWRELKPAILTVTNGWSESFSRFEKGEAPMMVSYATDGAYSHYYYGSTRYKAFMPKEGGYVQIEGAGIVNGTKNLELAQKFIEFVLTDDFQKEIPLNQWMFPVTDVEMSESFNYALKPEKILKISSEDLTNNLEKWLDEWEKIMF